MKVHVLGTFVGLKMLANKDAFFIYTETEEKKYFSYRHFKYLIIWYHSMGTMDKGVRMIEITQG